jgi:hypothetical protein
LGIVRDQGELGDGKGPKNDRVRRREMPAESKARVPCPISIILAISLFRDKRHIYACPFRGLLPYNSEIRDMPLQGGNEVWGEFF